MARRRRSRSRDSSESSEDSARDDSGQHALLNDEEHGSKPAQGGEEDADRRRRNAYILWGSVVVVLVIIVGVLVWLGMMGKLSFGGEGNPVASNATDTATQDSETNETSSPTNRLPDVAKTEESEEATTGDPSPTSKPENGTADKVVFTGDSNPTPTTTSISREEAIQSMMDGLDPKNWEGKQKPSPTVSVNWALYSNVPSTLPKETPKDVKQFRVNFKDMTNQDSLVSFLEKNQMILVDGARFDGDPLDYEYSAKQAKVADDCLLLTVKKGKENGVTYGAQIATKEKKIQYGLITTRAKLTSVQGIRQSIQFAFDKEDAIELGAPSSFYGSTQGITGLTPGLQMKVIQGDSVRQTFSYVRDVDSDFRDFTLFWTPYYVVMFVDGKSFGTSQISEGIPKRSAAIKWGVFCNGDNHYSAGPPEEDATMKIASIEGWYVTGPND
ncbi:hypothetical protein ACM66B_005318 [Microbotryomycetes sp. NB124-2]